MLPKWKTKFLNIKEIKDEDGSSKLQLSFVIEATKVEQFHTWLNLYEEQTCSNYYIRTTAQCDGSKVQFSRVLICHHNTRSKITKSLRKTNSQKLIHNTNCPSSIRVKLYTVKKRKPNAPVHLRDETMMCHIVLVPIHNHEVSNTLLCRKVTDDMKQKLIHLFDRGHNTSTAREILRFNIHLNYNDYSKLISDKKYYLDYQSCAYRYMKYNKLRETSVSTEDDGYVLLKQLEEYCELMNDDSVKFSPYDDGYVIT